MSIFVSQKSLEQWLNDYAVSHQNPINKVIHWLCVPMIFLTIVILLYSISPLLFGVITLGVMWFYLRLSVSLLAVMLAFLSGCIAIYHFAGIPLWFWKMMFAAAWIGQFVGHKIEGKKPSFFEDLQFLLIGPAWVADDLFKKILKR